ncbi:MAG TPA: hypothetical protein PLP21_09460 [Pyrinomonadaceae bacterium]|nr:hypothetical protein [Acidobacteriota bacterium]HQZ96533.1 hypothetical protein [Pyrinomonadaceae bacterium]
MNKTAQVELHRLFLVEGLPEPLTPASSHLQIFDNYIENTRIRLRQIRDPYSSKWTRVLQQRFPVVEDHGTVTKLAEIYLNEAEYGAFERSASQEIRKNRYFHEIDLVAVAFDIFLGPLQGLTTARVDFETKEAMENYIPPPFFIFEASNDPFFSGENLVTKTFAEIKNEVEILGQSGQ